MPPKANPQNQRTASMQPILGKKIIKKQSKIMEEDLIDIKYHSEDVGIRTYKVKYIAQVTHKGLKEYKIFTAFDEDILENKVQSHIEKLEEKWDKIMEKYNVVKEQKDRNKEAQQRTRAAIEVLEYIDNVLIHTLKIDDTIDWEVLKDKSKFKEPTIKFSIF